MSASMFPLNWREHAHLRRKLIHRWERLSKPRDGEMLLKQWLAEEADRIGISPKGIYERLSKGQYPNIGLRYVTRRTVLVFDKL